MRKLMPLCIAAALLGMPAAGSAQTVGQEESRSYFEDSGRGWHFYEPTPPPAPKPPKPEPKPPVVAGGEGEKPAPLSTAWIRENLPRIRDRAIDNPTRENVETFALMQRLSMDMAERFADVMALVSQDPAIDEYARSPLTAMQRAAAEQVENRASAEALQAIGKVAGLWYFYRSDCPYCAAQDPVLKRFSDESGIDVLAISLDGLPLPSGLFPNFVNDSGQAAQLNVVSTPTLVLAHPASDRLYTVAAGLKTRPELTERILQIAYAEGWITDDEYARATRGQSRTLMTADMQSLPTDLDEDPKALLEHLRALTNTKTSSTPLPEDAP